MRKSIGRSPARSPTLPKLTDDGFRQIKKKIDRQNRPAAMLSGQLATKRQSLEEQRVTGGDFRRDGLIER